jgi:hypothetical protein
MKISRYTLSLDHVPVDLFADPDGAWEFNDLVEAAGFDPEKPGIVIGALSEPFHGHPEGCAVVAELGRAKSFVAIIECGGGAEQALPLFEHSAAVTPFRPAFPSALPAAVGLPGHARVAAALSSPPASLPALVLTPQHERAA